MTFRVGRVVSLIITSLTHAVNGHKILHFICYQDPSHFLMMLRLIISKPERIIAVKANLMVSVLAREP